MAHELEIVNGQAQMAYVGEVPWHGLGVQVPEDTSAMDMMALAGLDWRVEELDSFVEFNGEKIPTGQKALVRDVDGKVLTQVGANWNPVQNSEAFEFFHEFVEAGNMKMHTAGSLKDGQIIWALAKVEDNFTLFNGDTVESYLLFSNPHTTKRKHSARHDVTIKLSHDGGLTWPVQKLLEDGPSAYSDLAVLQDESILCFYESGVDPPKIKRNRDWAYANLTLAHFNLEWLTK